MTRAGSRRRWTTVLAIGLAVLALASAAATVALIITNRPSNLAAVDLPTNIIPIGFVLVGVLVASRKPRNPIGWLFLFTAVVMGITGAAEQYARFALVTHPGSPGGVWALWLDSWFVTGLVLPGAIPLLLLLFPDGHLPSRRWRPVAVTALIVTGLAIPAGVFASGPLQTVEGPASPRW